jgi:hypothetical protein
LTIALLIWSLKLPDIARVAFAVNCWPEAGANFTFAPSAQTDTGTIVVVLYVVVPNVVLATRYVVVTVTVATVGTFWWSS